jgi:deoxyribonuclease-1
MKRLLCAVLACGVSVGVADAAGNEKIESFNTAKRVLEKRVYHDHRETLYCRAPFDSKKNIDLPLGFSTPGHAKRAGRIEWEHVVPAENFGKAFREWREGDARCVNEKNGKPYKGRKCAEEVSREYQLMQADLYNLYPAIGAVNAIRSNHGFTMLPNGTPSTFGTCEMKVVGNKVEPPVYTRGVIARTYKYMAEAYPKRFNLSRQQRQLMDVWDKQNPVDAWECLRARRIEKLQGNENRVVKNACINKGLWP